MESELPPLFTSLVECWMLMLLGTTVKRADHSGASFHVMQCASHLTGQRAPVVDPPKPPGPIRDRIELLAGRILMRCIIVKLYRPSLK